MRQNRNARGAGERHGEGRRRGGGPLSRREFLRQATLIAGGGLLAAGAGLALAREVPKPNIILLTADALRADHVGAYGYARPTTPHLDRLAAESVLFDYAFAATSYTGPSLASLHTGKYPREHFMRFKNGGAEYSHTDPALAALLKAHGYQTAAFVSNHVLERTRSQMDKGFDYYDDHLTQSELNRPVFERDAHQTTAAVIHWLKEKARPPFFLWVHYIEPHGPYTPAPSYARMFVGDPLYKKEGRTLEIGARNVVKEAIPLYQVLDAQRNSTGQLLSYNRNVADYVARYDGEIRSLDEAVGRFLQAIKAQELYETAWVLFSSDHGESLGERGYYFQHGQNVTLELVRVPLLIKPPGKVALRHVTTQVSLVDLMPTLLEVVGVKPPAGLSGQSVLSLLQGGGAKSSPLVFSDRLIQYSVIDERYQLLVGYETQRLTDEALRGPLKVKDIPLSLFAYRSDPLGEKDLAGSDRDIAEARFRKFRAFWNEYHRRSLRIVWVKRSPIQDSAETREALKQLGY